MNKNISIWRGNTAPPTPYHLWLKDSKLYHYDGTGWKENEVDLSTGENDGLMSKEDKHRLDNLVYNGLDSDDTDKALSAKQGKILSDRLEELNLSAYLIRGSVETLDDIPYDDLLSGDVYNIIKPFYIDGKRYPEGTNVVWTGTKLDPLGGVVDFKNYSTTSLVKDMINSSYLRGLSHLVSYKTNTFMNHVATEQTCKCKQLTIGSSPDMPIYSITLKIADDQSLLNHRKTYLHIKRGNLRTVSLNGIRLMSNLGKYVTWFFDGNMSLMGGNASILSLHTTNIGSEANDDNLVNFIICGLTVRSDDVFIETPYNRYYTPELAINYVDVSSIYPHMLDIKKHTMSYATSELSDLTTPSHRANIKKIRINLSVMGISLINSVSIMVADDNAYDGLIHLHIYDTNSLLTVVSKNVVNLSDNLGKYVTWYFTPFELTENVNYEFFADNEQLMRIHVSGNKNEGVICVGQHNYSNEDFTPALGINIEPIVTDEIYSKVENIENILTEVLGNIDEVKLNLGTTNAELTNTKQELTNTKQELSDTKTSLDNIENMLEDIYAYGVEWDTNVSDPHLTRIGNMSLHKTLPIQSLLKGCIAQANKIIYWLNENDWRFRKDPEIISINLTVDGGYSLVSDVFSTLRYEKLWIKILDIACLIESIDTNTNTATLVANDQLDTLNLSTGTLEIELGSVLNGYDGTVRVYCPNFYFKSEIEGTKRRVLISTINVRGTFYNLQELLADAYRSTILNTVPENMGYLSTLPVNSAISVVNTHDYCRGGGNRSEYDVYLESDPFRSDLGKPISALTRSTMRTYSRNAGSEMLSYDLYKNIFYWLYVIEYANFNCQEAYNEALTTEGYKLGGLGEGVTTIYYVHGIYYNNLYSLTPCGYCNDLGNGTGLKTMTVITPTTSGGDPTLTYNFSVPRWRGFDNPFGDSSTMLDGIIIQGNYQGNPKTVYITTDPNKYGDDEAAKNTMEIAGHLIYFLGYIEEFDLGEAAHIIPKSIRGDTTKYKCDYNLPGSYEDSLDGLYVGGTLTANTMAGLGYFNSHVTLSLKYVGVCFRTVSTSVSLPE